MASPTGCVRYSILLCIFSRVCSSLYYIPTPSATRLCCRAHVIRKKTVQLREHVAITCLRITMVDSHGARCPFLCSLFSSGCGASSCSSRDCNEAVASQRSNLSVSHDRFLLAFHHIPPCRSSTPLTLALAPRLSHPAQLPRPLGPASTPYRSPAYPTHP